MVHKSTLKAEIPSYPRSGVMHACVRQVMMRMKCMLRVQSELETLNAVRSSERLDVGSFYSTTPIGWDGRKHVKLKRLSRRAHEMV